jgi:chromosome segregation ATPase
MSLNEVSQLRKQLEEAEKDRDEARKRIVELVTTPPQVEERHRELAVEVARLRKANHDLEKKNALLEADRNQLLQVLRERGRRVPPPVKLRDLKPELAPITPKQALGLRRLRRLADAAGPLKTNVLAMSSAKPTKRKRR